MQVMLSLDMVMRRNPHLLPAFVDEKKAQTLLNAPVGDYDAMKWSKESGVCDARRVLCAALLARGTGETGNREVMLER